MYGNGRDIPCGNNAKRQVICVISSVGIFILFHL